MIVPVHICKNLKTSAQSTCSLRSGGANMKQGGIFSQRNIFSYPQLSKKRDTSRFI